MGDFPYVRNTGVFFLQDSGAFNQVRSSPKQLQIREVKRLFLLLRVRQIKTGKRDFVVDVPAFETVIRPGHAGRELLF